MSGVSKGVLGVKKDPKKPILFQLTGRGAEPWPDNDDSSDSDYVPEAENDHPPPISENVPRVKIKIRRQKQGIWVVNRDSNGDATGSENNRTQTSPVIKTARPKKKRKRKNKSSEKESDTNSGSDVSSPTHNSDYNSINTQTDNHKHKRKRKKSHKSSSGEPTPAETVAVVVPLTNADRVAQHILDTPCTVSDIWGIALPHNVLQSIFTIVIASKGPLPFLIRASQVCRLWKEVAYNPSLWKHLDLTRKGVVSEDRTLVTLCIDRVSQLREINLNGWKNLSNNGLQCLADYAPELESISVSHCQKVTHEGLRYLIDNAPKIRSLDISYLTSKTVAPASLMYILEKCHERLKLLNLSGNTLVGFPAVLKFIIESCPNLECFEISNAHFSTESVSLDIEAFQTNCPKLRVFNMTNSRFRAKQAPARIQATAPGFPLLEELSVAVEVNAIGSASAGMDNDFLHRLLKCSHNLKVLDLRGNSRVTVHGVQQLPITDLKHLFLSQSSVAKYDGIEVIVQKWQHSLEELDLAWNVYPAMSLDTAMRKLSDDPESSRLRTLNLSGTCISCSRLKSLLEGCPNLSTLNLGSCRGLPRGMKRAYTGKDLDELRRNIDYYIQSNSGDLT